jgi:hypothetical protein
MLIIKTTAAIEKITVTGEVPEHRDVADIKPEAWSAKTIRPNTVRATFIRENGAEWTLHSLRLYGYDVLKGGKPSSNDNCYREATVPRIVSNWSSDKEFAEDQFTKTRWARDWAACVLARINDVTVRADLDSDVVLGKPTNLDEPQPRRFPLDSPEPRENGLRLRSEVNGVVFRYVEAWGKWAALTESGGDGNLYMWHSLNSSMSEYATGEMVEVLS